MPTCVLTGSSLYSSCLPEHHTAFHTLFSTSSLQVSLETQQDMSVSLIVSYVISNASWSSAYDVRVFTRDKAMKVYTPRPIDSHLTT